MTSYLKSGQHFHNQVVVKNNSYYFKYNINSQYVTMVVIYREGLIMASMSIGLGAMQRIDLMQLQNRRGLGDFVGKGLSTMDKVADLEGLIRGLIAERDLSALEADSYKKKYHTLKRERGTVAATLKEFSAQLDEVTHQMDEKDATIAQLSQKLEGLENTRDLQTLLFGETGDDESITASESPVIEELETEIATLVDTLHHETLDASQLRRDLDNVKRNHKEQLEKVETGRAEFEAIAHEFSMGSDKLHAKIESQGDQIFALRNEIARLQDESTRVKGIPAHRRTFAAVKEENDELRIRCAHLVIKNNVLQGKVESAEIEIGMHQDLRSKLEEENRVLNAEAQLRKNYLKDKAALAKRVQAYTPQAYSNPQEAQSLNEMQFIYAPPQESVSIISVAQEIGVFVVKSLFG